MKIQEFWFHITVLFFYQFFFNLFSGSRMCHRTCIQSCFWRFKEWFRYCQAAWASRRSPSSNVSDWEWRFLHLHKFSNCFETFERIWLRFFIFRGFCYFNSIAIAAKLLRLKMAVERVLILDWVRSTTDFLQCNY